MKANPGGYIPPDEVLGRDKLIQRLWRILERQSLVLSAERRMGKTCVINKMRAEAPEGKLTIYRDLEGIQTAGEFAQTVFEDVDEYLTTLNRAAEGARRFLGHLSGLKIAGVVKIPDSFEESEMVRDMLILLQRDHYVLQQTDGAYCFRFPLIQCWWRLHRGVKKP